MTRLPRLYLPMRHPEDVIPFLGRRSHWKEGRSAKCLADSWFSANDLPSRVRSVLEQVPGYTAATLVDAFVERCTSLEDGRTTPSQTDLLAVVGLADQLSVIGVEAKVTETFGPLVREWLDDGGGKPERLAKLCALLDIDGPGVFDLRYQLLHRTASALLEARRYRAKNAVMLVHSFCPQSTGLDDFVNFARALGCAGAGKNLVSEERLLDGMELRLAWVADVPLAAHA